MDNNDDDVGTDDDDCTSYFFPIFTTRVDSSPPGRADAVATPKKRSLSPMSPAESAGDVDKTLFEI